MELNIWQEFKREQQLYASDVQRGLITRSAMRQHAIHMLRKRLAA